MLRRIALCICFAALASAGLVAAASPSATAPVAAADAARSDAAADAAPPPDALRDAPDDAPRDGTPDAIRPDAKPDSVVDAAVPACITWWTEARYRPFGYDHIVHIKSACARPADCSVSTDVNPVVQKVLVPANAKVEVFTFLVSPAREFKATVVCKLRD
jgi:hypothetical protein